jgi:hypothetical protein
MQDDGIIGIFVGLESSSNEYLAHLIAPYRQDLAIEIGNILLIQGVHDTIVSRVMDYVPRGEFTSFMGEKWLNEIASQGAIDAVGADIKKSKISYRVRIKILGALDKNQVFIPGLKRIPHITSKVAIPDESRLEKIISKALALAEQSAGANIGFYNLNRKIGITFDMRELNSKRTFIFARAGYGKSNLMKMLCAEWKEDNGGLLIFDPEGEYAVTDKKGRPGIMDKRPAILITNRKTDPNLKNVYNHIKLNLSELPHRLVIPLLVSQGKHDTVFFGKLMAMKAESWPKLVDLLYSKDWSATYEEIEEIVLGFSRQPENGKAQEIDIKPIQNNLIPPIKSIHDPHSNLLKVIEKALREGHVVIFDVSQMDSKSALLVSSLVVKYIFEENRKNFISYGGEGLIKATFVLEEAHTILTGIDDASLAFVSLAKEGRKYNLGGIFITQQPGSIPPEITSQGDNFFIFHLLSKGDLKALSSANAHYSDDIITQVLNEPIKGKCYMWTSHQPFVIPVDIKNFEDSSFAKPHQSVEIQNQNNILESIRSEIRDEIESPEYKSIFEKFLQVEKENNGKEMKVKTMALFKKLNPNEREYLQSRHSIQLGPYDNKPFAVTFQFYRRLLIDAGMADKDIQS